MKDNLLSDGLGLNGKINIHVYLHMHISVYIHTGSPHFAWCGGTVKMTMQAEAMQSDVNNQWEKF